MLNAKFSLAIITVWKKKKKNLVGWYHKSVSGVCYLITRALQTPVEKLWLYWIDCILCCVLLRWWPRLSVNSAGDHLNSTVIINSNHRVFKIHLNLWCRKLPLYIPFSPNYSFPVRFRWHNTFTDRFICHFDLAATSVTLRWVPWGKLFVLIASLPHNQTAHACRHALT